MIATHKIYIIKIYSDRVNLLLSEVPRLKRTPWNELGFASLVSQDLFILRDFNCDIKGYRLLFFVQAIEVALIYRLLKPKSKYLILGRMPIP